MKKLDSEFLPEVQPDAVYSKVHNVQREFEQRGTMMVSLGCHVEGAVCPIPDTTSPNNAIEGSQKRFARADPPEFCRSEFEKFAQWVRDVTRTCFTPCTEQELQTFDEWLEDRPYTLKRKNDLKKTHSGLLLDGSIISHRHGKKPVMKTRVKCFVKEEFYPEYKFSRCINSRDDEFKVYIGRFFRAIEKVVFKDDDFAKYIPVADRGDWLQSKLLMDCVKCCTTDFTAMEASIKSRVFEEIEIPFYEHMLQGVHGGRDAVEAMRLVLPGRNNCMFRDFNLRIDGCRMSGEMNTSLGNGFVNKMLISYYLFCHGKDWRSPKGIEGDDGIFLDVVKSQVGDFFTKLGFRIKLLDNLPLSEASFCGIVADEDDKKIITDPREVLATLGWANRNYMRMNDRTRHTMIRAKAMSMAYSYQGCPVLSACARWLLRCTKSYDVRHFISQSPSLSEYEREQLLAALNNFSLAVCEVKVGQGTRDLVERLYEVPVEVQLRMEAWFDAQTEIRPIPALDLGMELPFDWIHFYGNYSFVSATPGSVPSLPVSPLRQPSFDHTGCVLFKVPCHEPENAPPIVH